MSTLKIKDGDGNFRFLEGTGTGLDSLNPFTPTNNVTIAGVATEAEQITANTFLQSIAAKDFSTAAKQDTMITLLSGLGGGVPLEPASESLQISQNTLDFTTPNVSAIGEVIDMESSTNLSVATILSVPANNDVNLILRVEYAFDLIADPINPSNPPIQDIWWIDSISGTSNPIKVLERTYNLGKLGGPGTAVGDAYNVLVIPRKARWMRLTFAADAPPAAAVPSPSTGVIEVYTQRI